MLHKVQSPTLIAEGSRTQGTLVFTSEAQVYGAVEGEVILDTQESLQIGRTGWVQGNVEAQGPVHIEGRVMGQVTSQTKISVSSIGTVQGNLIAPRIEISPGAKIEGEIQTTTPRNKTTSLKHAA